jgi:hypothetical protein
MTIKAAPEISEVELRQQIALATNRRGTAHLQNLLIDDQARIEPDHVAFIEGGLAQIYAHGVHKTTPQDLIASRQIQHRIATNLKKGADAQRWKK